MSVRAIDQRRALGIHYTPPALAGFLLREALSGFDHLGPPLTADLSCGGGALLTAAARAIADRHALPSGLVSRQFIFGVDIDPNAAEETRASLVSLGASAAEAAAAVLHAEALTADLSAWTPSVGFDLIVGNPPFVDSETMTRHHPELRAQVRARYATARGNWDLSVPFVERSLDLLRPGGRLALILPRRAFGSDYAAALHALLFRHSILAIHDLTAHDWFEDASSPVCVLIAEKCPARPGHIVILSARDERLAETRRESVPLDRLRDLPPGHILAHLATDDPALLDWMRSPCRIAALASAGDSATTTEAYAIAEHVRESTGAPGEIRLVNTGAIDPFHTLWGERPVAYLGRRFRRPVIDAATLRTLFPKRHEQARTIRVGIAGLARRIEAAVLTPGVLSGKSTTILTPQPGLCPHAITAFLNAPRTTRLFQRPLQRTRHLPRRLELRAPSDRAAPRAPARPPPLGRPSLGVGPPLRPRGTRQPRARRRGDQRHVKRARYHHRAMSRALITVLLLIGSNIFMTWAWYGHLKKAHWAIGTAIMISWLIALPEYILQVPANRLGHISQGGPFTAPQLKVLQEAITLMVFTGFTIMILKEKPRPNDYIAFGLVLAAVVVSMMGRASTQVITPAQP